MTLVHIANPDRFAHVDVASVWGLFAHDHAEQGGLSGAVGADDAHNARRRKLECEVLHEELVPKRFGQAAGLDDLVSKAGAVGNGNVESGVLFLGALRKHALVVVDAGLILGAASLGALANPIELAVKFFPALALVYLCLSGWSARPTTTRQAAGATSDTRPPDGAPPHSAQKSFGRLAGSEGRPWRC